MDTETLAWLYLEQGYLEKAAEVFERLLAGKPDSPAARQGLDACRARMRARGSDMDVQRRLQVLRVLLARLTGEARAPIAEPAAREAIVAVPEVVAAPPPRTLDPTQRRLEVLRGMLRRLESLRAQA